MYTITILNYRVGKVDAILNVPQSVADDNSKVEAYLDKIGYPVNDCNWIITEVAEDYDGIGEILGFTDENHQPHYIDQINY